MHPAATVEHWFQISKEKKDKKNENSNRLMDPGCQRKIKPSIFWAKVISNLEFYIQPHYQRSSKEEWPLSANSQKNLSPPSMLPFLKSHWKMNSAKNEEKVEKNREMGFEKKGTQHTKMPEEIPSVIDKQVRSQNWFSRWNWQTVQYTRIWPKNTDIIWKNVGKIKRCAERAKC